MAIGFGVYLNFILCFNFECSFANICANVNVRRAASGRSGHAVVSYEHGDCFLYDE